MILLFLFASLYEPLKHKLALDICEYLILRAQALRSSAFWNTFSLHGNLITSMILFVGNMLCVVSKWDHFLSNVHAVVLLELLSFDRYGIGDTILFKP